MSRTSRACANRWEEEAEVEPCLGFEGLKQEHEKMLDETASRLIDLVDIGAATRTDNLR